MKVGMHYFWHQGSPDRLVADARRCEAAGFDLFGLTDSQLLFRDIYASLALVARETSSLDVGPMVTNPVTRHPSVIAGGICSIAELTAARAVLGIGSGHSAVDTVGQRPARLAELEEIVPTIRSLCRGESVDHDGTSYALEWVQHDHEGFDVPAIMAAEGPKTQRLAGTIADGVIFNGPHPDLIDRSIRWISEGASEAGRDPGDLEMWVKIRANVAGDRETAIEELRTSLADYAYVMLKNPANHDLVPEEYKFAVETFVDEYESHSGYHDTDSDNAAIVGELGLSDFFADQFAIVGTPDQCVDQLRELQTVDGVDGVLLATEPDYQRSFIDRMGKDVLDGV